MRRRASLLVVCTLSSSTWAGALFVERSATTTELFGDESAKELAHTLPVDRSVKFRLRIPDAMGPSGVVVFIKPDDTGTFPANWGSAFDSHNLIWISPDDFGNRIPTGKRILSAIMGAAVARRVANVDAKRVYVAGLSGGGRVASQAITRYPEQFTGAICIVGADYFMPEEPLKSRLLDRRLVLITGAHDFNRNELRQVYRQYGKAGLTHVKLLYLPHLGHEYPSGEELGVAFDFLDAR